MAGCLLAACGQGVTTPGQAGQAPSPSPAAHGHAATADPAVQLRSTLEMLLGEHVRLTVLLMRDRVAGRSDRAAVTLDSVTANADELGTAVEGLFGAPAGPPFRQLWAAHVDQLQDYAAGLADDDAAARDRARRALVLTEGDLGRLLSTASSGRLSPAAAQDALRMHVDLLLGQADAYAARDFGAAYAAGREGFAHMLGTADALAGAFATAKGFALTELRTPRRQLQSALSRLFAEHMGLMVEVQRAAVDGAAELPAAQAALNGNTADLGAAVGALYGRDASVRFVGVWAGHVEGLVDYAQAVKADDAQARDAATLSLAGYADRLAQFLASATANRLPARELAAALTEHDRSLTRQTDAYSSGDLRGALELADDGYRHMFALSQTLADAIGDRVASGLPRGGAQTGGGGAAVRR